jgi:translation initiation factor IF-1
LAPARCSCRPEGLAKEDLLTLNGLIEEILPDGRFRVSLENGHRVIVYTAGKMRKYRIRTLVGDRVQIEMLPYDLEKGRLVCRERVASTGFTPRRGNRR